MASSWSSCVTELRLESMLDVSSSLLSETLSSNDDVGFNSSLSGSGASLLSESFETFMA